MTVIDLSIFFTETAKLSEINTYIEKVESLAGNGNEVHTYRKGSCMALPENCSCTAWKGEKTDIQESCNWRRGNL